MELGIALPNAVPDTTGRQLTDWARAAEDAGFASLGTIDRIVYPNYDPVTALAAVAPVTERIRLATTAMLGPLRRNAALVAKQALSIDALAGGGRMVLGVAAGPGTTTTRSAASRWRNAARGSTARWATSAASGPARASTRPGSVLGRSVAGPA